MPLTLSMEPNIDPSRVAERQAAAIVRLTSHRDIEQAVLDAHAAGLTPTHIAEHAGRTRQWVHGILRKHAKATEETL
jgi:predicted transcriptional regulator